jgi:hypothetical protein
MTIGRVGHEYIVRKPIPTRQSKLIPIYVHGYGSVPPYPLDPADTHYTPVHYNFSIQHQTTIISHLKNFIILVASNENFSTKQHVMVEN